jgi:hypothetical protein
VKKSATRQKIEETDILISAPEHALLEAFTTRPGQDITDTGIALRWLKKNVSTLREEVFAEFIPHKYISATNRLKYFAADNGMSELHELMIRLIDRHGK